MLSPLACRIAARLFLFFALNFVYGGVALAAQPVSDLLLLVSQRNAETIAHAEQLLRERYPALKALVIQARTDSQLAEMPPAERALLIENSRALIGIGLYGPSVANLLEPLQRRAKQQAGMQLLFSSDHRLVALSAVKQQLLFDSTELLTELTKSIPGTDFDVELNRLLKSYPKQQAWLNARAYWQAGESENTTALYAWALQQQGHSVVADKPQPVPQLRWFYQGRYHQAIPAIAADQRLIAVIDHAGGSRPADAQLLREICQNMEQLEKTQCITGLAYWGQAGVTAVQQLMPFKTQLSAVVMLQDFVIGGGEGRQAVTEAFSALNVPVIKAIKLRDRSAIERQLSSDGLAQEKVYYQVAMPELQGASQPLVIATAGDANNHAPTGIRVQGIVAEASGIRSLIERIQRWHRLQTINNSQKRLAIIYYNHPPGRHNVGADNLDVPASLWQILNSLKAAGYHTGPLPASQSALLDMIQARGINLPRDATALKNMSANIQHLSTDKYQQWFSRLPATVQQEMQQGPLGLLHEQIARSLRANKPSLAQQALAHTLEEMHHLLEGVDHKGRGRALALLSQLENCYASAINNPVDIAGASNTAGSLPACFAEAPQRIQALQQTGIEGLGGWGPAPGNVMTYKGDFLLPGLQFGNIFIGPQPPRGWEINEELLHANLAFPPPHQYLAFYHFLRDYFKADAFVHLGRHSTYEFLPRRSVGLAEDDYSRIVAGDVPGIYPYIVDGVGEGIQAKRRGLAVIVDHLTPPLESTPLYDELLQLRQLIESFEANHAMGNNTVAQRLVQQIRHKVDALELKEELAQAMSAELAIMGIAFDDVDDDMLVHEIGHYLTDLQERFMPLGLHIFGREWQPEAVDMMLKSMLSKTTDKPNKTHETALKQALIASPKAEITALLKGLDGGYIVPGQGNDPIRSPDSLPTGRNFYALDSSLIPSRTAWQLGQELATAARNNNPQHADKREALILWASDVVRDEGVMIAFGLDMLGLEPVWNSRGLVKGLKRQALTPERVRRDTVFTTSGLFRDLYGQQLLLLNRATLMALDASAETIQRDYPALSLPLLKALEPLGSEAIGGHELLAQNQVAAHWVTQARELLASGFSHADAGVLASLRIFGDAPGSYGTGINRLVERSGAWEQRDQLARVYMRRVGHSYGAKDFGKPAQAVFQRVLADVENTYLGRSSNLYGLIDNNDAFDYLGGLSLAIETLTGQAPNNFVIDHANPNHVTTQPLALALRQELRGRFLNPEWLKGQMAHGYAGARTMGSEFLEYLWGWQVTNPTLVGDWAWEEVKAVYIDDRHQLGLDTFLQQGHNAHVKSNMLAIMLVAIHKGFWQADDATKAALAQAFADLVAQHGLPGSGHTDPDHPMLPWLEQFISASQWAAIAQAIQAAKATPQSPPESVQPETHAITEVTVTTL